MIPRKPTSLRLTTLFLFFLIFSSINISAQDGRALFMTNCASCHTMGKDATGPNLQGVIGRWGGDTAQLLVWVKNWGKATHERAKEVVKFSSTSMTNFDGTLNDAQIMTILNWADSWVAPPPPPEPPNGGGGNDNAVIFGVISLILAIIALILMQVNSNLKKLSDDTEGISRPEPVPFYRNKTYIAVFAILFFVVGGYLVTMGGIGLGRQKGYQPVQPIYYSHKVHAGINQISCLFCHGSAWESKTAAIPSVNVCMNCHKSINEYTNGPDLYDANGEKIDGTAEIAKLYKAAGFDPKNPSAWDPSQAKA